MSIQRPKRIVTQERSLEKLNFKFNFSLLRNANEIRMGKVPSPKMAI
jgi:hypothetical protein